MKKTIESLNTSIRKAAEEIGISHSTLSGYIQTKANAKTKTMTKKC
ncbi:helix-turn-helix domain-containing protein [Peribacillus butanolivorans]